MSKILVVVEICNAVAKKDISSRFFCKQKSREFFNTLNLLPS